MAADEPPDGGGAPRPAAAPAQVPVELERTAIDATGGALGPALERGAAVGRYVVLGLVGAGAMGAVYAAYDPTLDRKVALKLLHDGAEGPPTTVDAAVAGSAESGGALGPASARLLREAQAMARLNHPNVIVVHDVGTIAGRVFVAMEFVEGRTLRAWLDAEPRPWSAIVERFTLAGRGLAAAHASGLVHRDFKPDNVLLGDDGRVRVSDFGLARAHTLEPADRVAVPDGSVSAPAQDPDDAATRQSAAATRLARSQGEGPLQASLTRTGAIVGTPAFMAPEQHLGIAADARADQFSFAVALFWALYGQHPFDLRSPTALVMSVTEGRVVDAPARGVPLPVRPVLVRALAPDPEQRFPDMDALLAALAVAVRPASRRRTRIAAVLGLSALAAGGAVALTLGVTAPDPCGGGDARVAGVWGDAARASLLARYGGRASAEGVERLEAALDRYAGAWARKHRDVCEATRLRGEQSPAALDLRMACMDRRLAELDALVSTLAAVPPAATAPASDGGDTAAGEDAVRAAAEGDALADGDAGEGALARAVQAAWSLPGFEPCDDLIALQRDGAARPPAIAAVWPEFEAELARARQLLAAGAWSRAQRAGEQLRVRAEGWGFAPAVAQVELVLGRAASEGGDIDGAAAHLRRAVLEGDRGQDDRTRVEAWLALAELRAKRTVDGAAAREGIEAAAALVERLGAPIDLQAELAQVEGAAAYEAGDYPRALARFELARGLRARSLGDDHPLVAHGDANVGTALHAIGRHDEAIVALDRAVASLERTLGPGHPDVARARNDRAVALADAGRLADALTDHRAALAIRSEAFGPRHAHVAASHNNLGALQRRMGALEDARRSYAEALGIWRSLHGDEHPRVASAQFNVAIIDEAAGDHQAAVEGYAAALRGFEAGLGPDHPHAIAARFGRGVALVNLGRGGEAVNDLTRVLVVREAEGADDWTGEARYWLAQALWARDAPAERDRPADRTRALELARTTLADYPSAAEDYATFTAEVRAWLEARAPGPASARGAAR